MTNTYKNFIITAKRGRGKSEDAKKRSKFLSLVMPHLSSDTGKSLAEAISNKDLEKFKLLWNGVTKNLIDKLEEEFKGDKREKKQASHSE